MQEKRYAMKARNGSIVWVPESEMQAFLNAQKRDAPQLTPEERKQKISEIRSLLQAKAGK